MKTNMLVALGFVAVAGTLVAAPAVSDVQIEATDDAALVKVSYKLTGERAIITFDATIDGDAANCGYAHAVGAVNQLLEPSDTAYTFYWVASKDLPQDTALDASAIKINVKAACTNNPPDYMMVPCELSTLPRKYYDKVEDIPDGITDFKYKTSYMAFRRIHARGKTFVQGLSTEQAKYGTHNARRLVTFSEDYYIGVYEYTVYQFLKLQNAGNRWYTFCEANKSVWETEKYNDIYSDLTGGYAKPYGLTRAVGGPTPKYYANGKDAAYVWPEGGYNAGSSHMIYYLHNNLHLPTLYYPTSAQWEFAARAGSWAEYPEGADSIGEYGWFTENNDEDPDYPGYFTHPVGMLKPNAWGLYDMLGNVREWCRDNAQATRAVDAEGKALVDPSGPTLASSGYTVDNLKKVIGGGSYTESATDSPIGRMPYIDWGSGAMNDGFRWVCSTVVDR